MREALIKPFLSGGVIRGFSSDLADLCAAYNPNKSESLLFFKYLTDLIDSYQTKYDNILVIGDLNMEERELIMKDFLLYFDMETLIKQPNAIKLQLTLAVLIFSLQIKSSIFKIQP